MNTRGSFEDTHGMYIKVVLPFLVRHYKRTRLLLGRVMFHETVHGFFSVNWFYEVFGCEIN